MPATTSTSSDGIKMMSNGTSGSASTQPQQEKPTHYKYLKEFRVEQCPSFLQHKCTQHKPFTCFNWHFMNQRRRRPVKRVRDGTFTYSADVYCTKYDETTGICPEGDDCPYLHRTAGDTERRYHLKYYKTGICIYDTDSRGFCVKNGPHCAFAHGIHDLRNPVYDVRELQSMETNGTLGTNGSSLALDPASLSLNGPNSLDKERNALNEDPRWQDNVYVLAYYKTDLCKRPPRLCRQGYACPQFHNSKDKRRTPKSFKYRSTPCPNVKQGDEWGDPINCDSGDACGYCHTRTEQQFHPEIYKSTKCHDIQQTGYCPRGPFCAFAHGDSEEAGSRHEFSDHDKEGMMGSKETLLLSSAPSPGRLIQNNNNNNNNNNSNGGRALSIASSLPDHYTIFGSPLGAIGSRPRSFSTSITVPSGSSMGQPLSRLPEGSGSSGGGRRGIYDSNSPIFSFINSASNPMSMAAASGDRRLTGSDDLDYGNMTAGTVGSMVESVLDDLTIDDEVHSRLQDREEELQPIQPVNGLTSDGNSLHIDLECLSLNELEHLRHRLKKELDTVDRLCRIKKMSMD